MEHGDEAIRSRFKAWDHQIARLQERALSAPAPEVSRFRPILADLAGARERAWSRWEAARAGGMWVTPEDVRRFDEAMREAEAAFARAVAEEAPRAPAGATASKD